MWWRRSWFSLKGKAGIPGQTEGRPTTSIGPRVPPVGSLQQRGASHPPHRLEAILVPTPSSAGARYKATYLTSLMEVHMQLSGNTILVTGGTSGSSAVG